MDFFLLPERKKMCKKIDIVSGFWGGFPLKGKYVEEPVRFDRCITVCIVNINDTSTSV